MVVAFKGRLDVAEATASGEVVAEALHRGPRRLVLDVREMLGYDSRAVAAWVGALNPARSRLLGLEVVGGNIVVRTGARVLAGVLDLPLTFSEAREAGPYASTAPAEAMPAAPQSSASPVLFDQGGLRLFHAPGLLVIAPSKAPAAESIRALTATLKQRRKDRERSAMVSVLSPRMGLQLDSAARAACVELGAVLEEQLRCHCLVLQGDSLFRSWARSLVAGLGTVVRMPYPTHIAGTTAECEPFLLRHGGPGALDGGARSVLEEATRWAAEAR